MFLIDAAEVASSFTSATAHRLNQQQQHLRPSMPAPHPAALSDFHLQSAAPNHKFTTPHELLPLQKSQTSEQHLLYADMLPYNTKDLSVTEHGELVGLLEQAVAARPAGCRAACRRRPAGCRARVGDAAPAPAGGRRCGRARAGPGKTRGCDGDCGAGGRAEMRASSRRPRPRARLRWGLRRGRADDHR